MKMTSKSCSCNACRLGKASKKGRILMKLEERAFRRMANGMLRRPDAQSVYEDAGVVPLAPKGGYFD